MLSCLQHLALRCPHLMQAAGPVVRLHVYGLRDEKVYIYELVQLPHHRLPGIWRQTDTA